MCRADAKKAMAEAVKENNEKTIEELAAEIAKNSRGYCSTRYCTPGSPESGNHGQGGTGFVCPDYGGW